MLSFPTLLHLQNHEYSQSYQFKSVTVRCYKQENISPFPKKGSVITRIENLLKVAEDAVPITIFGATVAAATLTIYSSCIACKSKVELPDSNVKNVISVN